MVCVKLEDFRIMMVRSNFTLTEEEFEWLRYQAYKRRLTRSAILREMIHKAQREEKEK